MKSDLLSSLYQSKLLCPRCASVPNVIIHLRVVHIIVIIKTQMKRKKERGVVHIIVIIKTQMKRKKERGGLGSL